MISAFFYLSLHREHYNKTRNNKTIKNTNKTITDKRLKFILSSSPAVIYCCKVEGDYGATFISDNVTTQLGYIPEDFINNSSFWSDNIHPDDRDSILSKVATVFEEGYLKHEYRFKHKDGSYRWMRDEIKLITDSDSKPVELIGYWVDITEQKLKDEQLQIELQKTKLNEEHTNLAVIEWNTNFEVVKWNPAAEKIFGYTKEESLNKHAGFIIPKGVKEDVDKVWEDLISKKGGEQSINNNTTKDGKVILCEWNNTPLLKEDGTVIGVASLAKDITKAKTYQGELEAKVKIRTAELQEEIEAHNQSESLLQLSSSIAHFGAWEWNIETGNLIWSDEIYHIFGIEKGKVEPEYSKFLQLVHPEDRDSLDNAVKQAVENNEKYDIEHRALLSDGTIKNIHEIGLVYYKDDKPIKMIGIAHDITEEKRNAEEIHKAQKLESLGILAGGIAHDFNNLLTSILGNISLIKLSLDPEDPIYNRLSIAEQETLNGSGITKQLLTFAKGGTPIKNTVLIGDLITNACEFAIQGSNVVCSFTIDKDLLPVEIDAGQIRQAIINIIINAMQAMSEGGTIKINASNTTLTLNDQIPLKEGEYVVLSIEDEGGGIPSNILSNIFDPYFTTKEKGSGLGLSSSHSIINKHDGYIDVKINPEIGTTFSIYLPVSTKNFTPEKKKDKVIIKGAGKVLFMDDDKAIIDVACAFLKHMGYQYGVARDGLEAIELYKEAKDSDEPFDAVIMDLTIKGGMGGKEALKKLFEIDPNAKVIVSSGYSNDHVMSYYKEYGFCGVLKKPYSVTQFSDVINKAVN